MRISLRIWGGREADFLNAADGREAIQQAMMLLVRRDSLATYKPSIYALTASLSSFSAHSAQCRGRRRGSPRVRSRIAGATHAWELAAGAGVCVMPALVFLAFRVAAVLADV